MCDGNIYQVGLSLSGPQVGYQFARQDRICTNGQTQRFRRDGAARRCFGVSLLPHQEYTMNIHPHIKERGCGGDERGDKTYPRSLPLTQALWSATLAVGRSNHSAAETSSRNVNFQYDQHGESPACTANTRKGSNSTFQSTRRCRRTAIGSTISPHPTNYSYRQYNCSQSL